MVEILSTKLFIPRPRLNLVARPRLIERLNAGQDNKLTLIAAPAGFGKTTLLSEWIPRSPRCVTWLSLDEGDNSPARFWMYFIAALQTISPELGKGVQTLIPTLQPHDIESILTVLINEINAFGDSFVHVFDDYHLIENTEIDHALAYLIDHQPSNLHLIIATRENPHLPLARLRARDQITELRAADLRFTPTEAAEFLHGMGLYISAEDIQALEDHTEGWIAGLQLAALSMQGRQDISGFIRNFAGDHRYVVDYLIEEVLQRQSECIRNFLLQTSILEQLNGPLCETVTGQRECNVLLENLERGNYFVIPLDDVRHWFRYHHLFADVLRMRLMAEQPEEVPVLHRRASEWYEQFGFTADAIRHALAAKDYPRAANLIELNLRAILRRRQEAAVLGWLKELPEELIHDRPVLCNGYAGVLLTSGKMDGVEHWLAAAERWLNPADQVDPTANMDRQPETMAAKMTIVDVDEFRRLPGAIAVHRAGLALMLGSVADTLKFARQAHDLAPQDDYLGQGSAAALQGLAHWTCGDLESGYRMYAEGIAWLKKAGNISDVLGCTLALADILTAQGRLHEIMRIFEQGLQLAVDEGTPEMRGTADMLVGLSEVYYEQNDLQAAMQHLLKSQKQGEHTGLPQNRYRWRAAMAQIRQAEGNLNEALDLLQQAERLYTGDFSPNVRPLGARKARIWAAQGRLGEALTWVSEQELSADDNLSYLHEFEHITLARILLARINRDRTNRAMRETIRLLERLLKAAEEGRRRRSAIEIQVLQALAHQALGDLPAALLRLQGAMSLAEPEGYIRMFLDEGKPMADLLGEAAAHGFMPDYTGKLLAGFEAEGKRNAGKVPLPASLDSSSLIVPAVQPAKNVLVEALSQRELEVLRLFKTELSGPEIAQELVIGLSTVRTHTKSIFSKLNVNSRRAAVRRAIELGLI